jgi:hypothetical protein
LYGKMRKGEKGKEGKGKEEWMGMGVVTKVWK